MQTNGKNGNDRLTMAELKNLSLPELKAESNRLMSSLGIGEEMQKQVHQAMEGLSMRCCLISTLLLGLPIAALKQLHDTGMKAMDESGDIFSSDAERVRFEAIGMIIGFAETFQKAFNGKLDSEELPINARMPAMGC